MQTQVTIHTDKALKNKVSQKARKQGLTISGLTTLFYRDFVENEQASIDTLEERALDNALRSAPVRQKLTGLDSTLREKLAQDAKDLAQLTLDDLPTEDEWVAIQPAVN